MAAPAASLELMLTEMRDELRALRREVAELREELALDIAPTRRRRIPWFQRLRRPDRCAACPHPTDLHWHHIVPLAEGGEDVFENVIALCPNCHAAAHAGRIQRDDLFRQRGEQEATNIAPMIRGLP